MHFRTYSHKVKKLSVGYYFETEIVRSKKRVNKTSSRVKTLNRALINF